MLNILLITNPLDLKGETIVRSTLEVQTIREALDVMNDGKFTQFQYPTIILVDQEPFMIARWEEPLKDGSTVSIVRLTEGVTAIVIAIIVVVVAVAVALVVPTLNPAAIGAANDAGQQQNGATVYSLTGERNQNRLNNCIESVYGRVRMWPAYAAIPYSVYRGNEQFQYSLFCLGQGKVKVESMQFEDTPIQNFEDIEFAIIGPGGTMTLFHDNVTTSSSVANIELFGPNESEFSGPSGPFVVNAAFMPIIKISVDLSFPRGLYKVNDTGDRVDTDIQVLFQYREISNLGAPLTTWAPLIFTNDRPVYTIPNNETDNEADPGHSTKYISSDIPYFYRKLKTVTPQRYTLNAKVPLGRYEIQGQRVNNKDKDTKVVNEVHWESLKGFHKDTKDYGDVTLVAVAAKATNNLNNNAAQRFNVIGTRRLQTWSVGAGWSATMVPTRNPIWAFCDVFMSVYGGRLEDIYLDMETLAALATTLDTEGIKFDYIFDQKTTVWEAARVIARVCRGVPMLNGSQITLIRDTIKIAIEGVFNQHNIIEGSLTWNIKLKTVEDFDGVEIEYVDAETWQPETVLCLIGGDIGDNPERIKLSGIVNRNRAYQEGLYIRACQLFKPDNLEFKTGLEGHLPQYGSLIAVSHDVPRWGTGGLVLAIAPGGFGLTLSEDVIFTVGETHKIILRKKDGTAFGPITVVAGVDARHVTMSITAPAAFYFDDVHERPYFLFGIETLECKRCTVVGLQPESEDVVTVRAVPYDETVFSFGATPTPLRNADALAVQELPGPVIASMDVKAVPGNEGYLTVYWTPAFGAKRYIVEQSIDGNNWTRLATLPSNVLEIRADPGPLYLRVAAVNIEVGPWVDWNGEVLKSGQVIPGAISNLRIFAMAPGAVSITWDEVPGADRYKIMVFNGLYPNRQLRYEWVKAGTSLFYTYTFTMGQKDGLIGLNLIFLLRPWNLKGPSAEVTRLDVSMLAPTNIVGGTVANFTTDITTKRVDTTLFTIDQYNV